MDYNNENMPDPSMLDQGFDAKPVVEVEKINFLDLARDAESSSTTWFDANVRPSVQASLRQFYGQHDPGSRYLDPRNRLKSNLFVPKTRSNIRKHEAALVAAYFSTDDIVEITAYDDGDPVESAAADFYKEIMNMRLTGSGPRAIPWMPFLTAAYQESMVNGLTIAFLDWNFVQDRPDPQLVPLENFRFDPACDWLNPVESSPYLIWKMPMRVGEIKNKIRQGQFLPVTDEQLANARRPETSTITQARNQGRTDPMQRSNSIKEYDIVWVHLNIINQAGIDWAFYTLGSEAYLTEPLPLEQVWKHGQRPFVIGRCVVEAHKNYPTSIPTMTRDLQTYLNRNVNQRIDNVSLALDKRYIVRAGARVDHESITRNSPGSITLVQDIEKDFKVISTPDVNPSAFKEQSLVEIAMDSITGGFDSGTMQSNRSLNETVGGMTLISQSANQVAEYQLQTFNHTFVEPVLRFVMLLEQHYESNENIIALAAKNATAVQKFLKNNGDLDFTDIRMKELMLKVRVGMGATNPATRLEKFTMAMNAFAQSSQVAQQMGMDIKEIAKEIFGALGYKDGERFFSQDVDPQVAALQQQVQQLQQELANKRNPDLDAANAELLKANAFKVRAEATFANIQAAQVIAAMPAVAPVADEIAQTNGFMDMKGMDPNYEQGLQPQGMTGALQSVGAQDPTALIAANEQAKAYKMRGNTDPILPATGVRGSMEGIKGGQG